MASDILPAPNFFEKHAAKIEYGAPSGCWLWTAGATGRGYGQVRSRGKVRYAHREAYENEHGTGSADGLVVRHKCDTPLCVNPDHLEIGTHADNIRDRDERGRHVALNGEACIWAKLTEADVRVIRATYVRRSRTHGQHALGRGFGVHHSVIGDIVRRKIWRHVA